MKLKKKTKLERAKLKFNLAVFSLLDFILDKLDKHKKKATYGLIFGLSFFVGSGVLAVTTLDINQNGSGGVSGASNVWGQSFTATKNNIKQFHFEVSRSAGATVNFDWYICKGTAGTSTFSTTYNCTANGNTLVASGTINSFVLQNNNQALQPSFVERFTMIDEQYYIAVHANNTFRVAYAGGTNDNYAGGTALPTTSWASYNDLYIQTWFESSYDPSYFTLTSPTHGQRFVNEPIVFAGTIYNPNLAYNGGVIEILNKNTWTSSQDIQIDISTTSATFSLELPYNEFEEVNYRAIAYLINRDTGVRGTSSIVNYVLGQNTVFRSDDAQYEKGGMLSEAQICGTIATSTFFGGVECAGRKLIYYSFTPNDFAKESLTKSINTFKNQFPFSVYFQLTDTVTNTIASTTLSNNDTIDVVMIDKDKNIITMPVLSSTSMPNLIGQDNTNLIRNTIGWFIWLGVAFLIFLTFRKI